MEQINIQFDSLVKSSAVKGNNTINDEKIIGEILNDYSSSLNYFNKLINLICIMNIEL
jgi:hypothetical protein